MNVRSLNYQYKSRDLLQNFLDITSITFEFAFYL